MKCDDAIDLIVDDLLDELNDEDRNTLKAHLNSCGACRAEHARLTETWDGLLEIEAPQPSNSAAVLLGSAIGRTRGRGRTVRRLIQIAAAIVLFGTGTGFGYVVRGSGDSGVPQVATVPGSDFLFLVRGDETTMDVSGQRIVSEYRAWANELAAEGRLGQGEKLYDEPGRWVTARPDLDPRDHSDIAGFFVVRAASYAEAQEIAWQSPHIRFGGTFEIREIEFTSR